MNDVRLMLPATQEIAITTALAKCTAAVDAVAPGRWAFTLSNGTDLAASARVDDGWLLLDAPLRLLPVARASRVWELLQWNATLRGGARFVLHPDQPSPRVRADLPLDEEVDLRGRILEACTGLKTAKRMVMYGPAETGEVLDIGGSGDDANGHLPDLCRQTKWGFIEREPGRLAVDLDVTGTFQQAIVEARGDPSIAVTVPVLDAAVPGGEPPASVCRQALGLLLLRVCGIVRMARAAAEIRDGATHARFEVVFGKQPCAAELTHAFAALSVACRLASREAAALWGDEVVARAYVEQWDQSKEGGPSWNRQQQ